VQSFKRVFEKLDLTKKNGLFILSEDEWQTRCTFSKRVEHLIGEVIKPDAFFYFNKTPFILFFDNPENVEQLHRQIWNFNQSPVIFIHTENQYHIYNGFSFVKEKTGLAELADFKKNLNDFNYFEIVTGVTWEKYQKNLKNKQRVDYKLLDNVKTLRKILTENITEETKDALPPHIANNLIGRILFIRYLIDREVRIQKKLWTNDDLCEVLSEGVDTTYQIFEYLQSKENYNGDLFPIEAVEKKKVQLQHLLKIVDLLKGTNLISGQQSLFDIYDFSIIPVELISNVYEFFIGVDNQESSGAYYTPLFLVDYVLSQTVEQYFDKYDKEYNCKVLDPACGSGIFLVESLRKIIWRFKALNKGCEDNAKEYHNHLRKLLKDNIFGVDIDKDAVNVAIFSLYITLLDFIDKPVDIETFKFPIVLNENFFVADFFNTKATYNKILSNQELDFIIGNPPWGDVPDREGNYLYEDYWRNREIKETRILKDQTNNIKEKVKIAIAKKEIAQAFLIRTKDFSKKNTKCTLVVTSKILYNLGTKTFRKYFLQNNEVHQVFELSSVRREVFDKSNDPAIASASVISYSLFNSFQESPENAIKHIALKPNLFFELFKIFVLEKYDYKEIPQHLFLSYDWLWKTLVYGNILDFSLTKRILKNYSSVKDVVGDKERFLVGTGLKYKDGDNKIDTKHHKGKDFVKSNIDLAPFIINIGDTWDRDFVGYIPADERIFLPPVLLTRRRISNKLTGISAVELETEKLFTYVITAIKALNKNDANILQNISALFNSNFLAYYLLQTNTSIGIERGDVLLKEIIKMPYVFDESIVSSYKSITACKLQLSQIVFEDIKKQQQEKKLENQMFSLNETIYSAFNLSQQDKDIVNYALEVSIPLIQRKKGYKYTNPILSDKKGKSYLKSYISVIANHFDHLFKNAEKKIQVNIYHSKYAIGIEFCVVDINNTSSKYQFTTNKDVITILNKFALLSFEKLSDELFIQKDIKGFEAESFYVIKPNEYKCWHTAIGHLDLSEILHATLKIGAEQKRLKEYAQ